MGAEDAVAPPMSPRNFRWLDRRHGIVWALLCLRAAKPLQPGVGRQFRPHRPRLLPPRDAVSLFEDAMSGLVPKERLDENSALHPRRRQAGNSRTTSIRSSSASASSRPWTPRRSSSSCSARCPMVRPWPRGSARATASSRSTASVRRECRWPIPRRRSRGGQARR